MMRGKASDPERQLTADLTAGERSTPVVLEHVSVAIVQDITGPVYQNGDLDWRGADGVDSVFTPWQHWSRAAVST